MSVNVYDETGRHYLVGETFTDHFLDQPLVLENRSRFSFPFGDAEIVQIGFGGIYIVYGDMVLQQSPRLHFEMQNERTLVELHFTLEGSGKMLNELNGSIYHFEGNRHNLHYMPQFSGTGEYLKNTPYKFFELHFTTQYFYELSRGSSASLMQFADRIASHEKTELINDSLPMSLAMHQCIRDIMSCRFIGGLKLMFLQSKCIELLALQAQMYEELAGGGKASVFRTDYDRERIIYARDYLLQHAVHPPSLSELAKVAGINEFKLKRGFKEVFNNTVFGYLNDHKLTQAKDLLLSGNIAIKEMASHLGYSSVPHFSNAFKKKFGTSPGKVRK